MLGFAPLFLRFPRCGCLLVDVKRKGLKLKKRITTLGKSVMCSLAQKEQEPRASVCASLSFFCRACFLWRRLFCFLWWVVASFVLLFLEEVEAWEVDRDELAPTLATILQRREKHAAGARRLACLRRFRL